MAHSSRLYLIAAIATISPASGCYAVRTMNEGAAVRDERRRQSAAPHREANNEAAREAAESDDCARIPAPGTYDAELLNAVAGKAATCGAWAMVFEDLMQWGNGPDSRGVSMLRHLQDEHDVEGAFLTWAHDAASPFGEHEPQSVEYALSHYFEFLDDLPRSRPCQDYDSVVDRLPTLAASIVLQRKYDEPGCTQPSARPTNPESAPSPAPTSTSNG